MSSAKRKKTGAQKCKRKQKGQGENQTPEPTEIELKERIDEVKVLWANARHVGRKAARYDQPNNVLRREVYTLAKWIWEGLGRIGAIDCLNSLRQSVNLRAKPMNDAFRSIINLVVTEEELSREEQTRFACELEYARRHRIPPELLIGFILQVGAGKQIKKLVIDAERREPWFKAGHELVWRRQ